MYTWYIFRSALKELEDKDSRLEAAEQATSASKLEAAAAQRKCEDTRRSGDIRLADLQLEAARQLSVLRSKNDSLGRENDQLRGLPGHLSCISSHQLCQWHQPHLT